MHHIIKNLWMGSQGDPVPMVRQNSEETTAILNVRGPDAYDPPGQDQSAEHPAKAYKWIPAPDIGTIYPWHVKEAVLWLREQTDKGARILIHCKYGISRSPGILAAYMVESGISPSLEEARAMIGLHRSVQPATVFEDPKKRIVLVSLLTGLPNRPALDEEEPSPYVAILNIDHIKVFSDSYGPIATEALIRRLARTLIAAGLRAYHDQEDEFLCTGDSPQELDDKLTRARQLFREPFEVYAD